MKKILVCVFALLALLGLATAANLSDEQKEIQTFIKKLYAIDSTTFEMGRFGGKFNPSKQAVLHSVFFSKELLSAVKDVTAVDGSGYVRHPSASDEDLSQISGTVVTKNPKMLPPVINGDKAYADVYPDGGRTIYFLKKAADGWRIINTASYKEWPNADGFCFKPFYLVPPTAEQEALETEFRACMKLRESFRPKGK